MRNKVVAFPSRTRHNRHVPVPFETMPFAHGALVLITLNSPREKFWGAVLDVNPAGISVRGVDLNSFDEVIGMVRAEEHVMAGTVFFPLTRVERMELDVSNGAIPSLAERFAAKCGRSAADFLGVEHDSEEPF